MNRITARTVEEGTGGPFAALVLDSDTGDVVSAGVNLVLSANVAPAHAEVVALSLAQTRVGDWNPGTDPARPRALVVNAQPCVMCLGTLIWSGVKALDFSVPGFEAERITGFDEGPVPADWREQLESAALPSTRGCSRKSARRFWKTSEAAWQQARLRSTTADDLDLGGGGGPP
ncbi:nucleoside deaminase [Streptomyces hygroscopicus]|uniref:nucleoside deaminase n=1 Tax=Streptomyces hygroscopicus TaxID=1912 RepID=UPI0036AE5680